jgi:hypothetical protein
METDNKAWYLVKENRDEDALIKARLDGQFSAKDLRIIADRIDSENKDKTFT